MADSCRSRGAALGSFGAPRRVTAQHAPSFVVDMEKGLWLPWKHRGEHINVLELRAVINRVLWRLRSAANIHSKGVRAMDPMVILGALAKGRSASRRLAPSVMKFNSLIAAASFIPLLVYCRTDLDPAGGPSRHVQESSHGDLGKARRKRLRATVGLFA